MKHKVQFYPLGNADTTLFKLNNGKKILWDFADKGDKNDDTDKRCDLPNELNKEVEGDFDIVCFTHADDDHIGGFSNYFYLEHDAKYQSEDRKKIRELWVPAMVLTDDMAEEEAEVLKQEARYRFRKKKGIKVFSRPKKLKSYCKQAGIDFDERRQLIFDAGDTLLSKEDDEVEFFIHSPFASDTFDWDRNSQAIICQVVFNNSCQTKIMMGSDITYDVWSQIVRLTEYKKRQERLEWDIFHISHHCSYTALSEEKGDDKTIPEKNVDRLYKDYGQPDAVLVSPSKTIPTKGSDEDNDNNPPHRQAANYYKEVANEKEGEFKVTMEHPTKDNPEVMIFEITNDECKKLLKESATGAAFVTSHKPPRAG